MPPTGRVWAQRKFAQGAPVPSTSAAPTTSAALTTSAVPSTSAAASTSAVPSTSAAPSTSALPPIKYRCLAPSPLSLNKNKPVYYKELKFEKVPAKCLLDLMSFVGMLGKVCRRRPVYSASGERFPVCAHNEHSIPYIVLSRIDEQPPNSRTIKRKTKQKKQEEMPKTTKRVHSMTLREPKKKRKARQGRITKPKLMLRSNRRRECIRMPSEFSVNDNVPLISYFDKCSTPKRIETPTPVISSKETTSAKPVDKTPKSNKTKRIKKAKNVGVATKRTKQLQKPVIPEEQPQAGPSQNTTQPEPTQSVINGSPENLTKDISQPPNGYYGEQEIHRWMNDSVNGDETTSEAEPPKTDPEHCPAKAWVTLTEAKNAPEEEMDGRCMSCEQCRRIDNVIKLSRLLTQNVDHLPIVLADRIAPDRRDSPSMLPVGKYMYLELLGAGDTDLVIKVKVHKIHDRELISACLYPRSNDIQIVPFDLREHEELVVKLINTIENSVMQAAAREVAALAAAAECEQPGPINEEHDAPGPSNETVVTSNAQPPKVAKKPCNRRKTVDTQTELPQPIPDSPKVVAKKLSDRCKNADTQTEVPQTTPDSPKIATKNPRDHCETVDIQTELPQAIPDSPKDVAKRTRNSRKTIDTRSELPQFIPDSPKVVTKKPSDRCKTADTQMELPQPIPDSPNDVAKRTRNRCKTIDTRSELSHFIPDSPKVVAKKLSNRCKKADTHTELSLPIPDSPKDVAKRTRNRRKTIDTRSELPRPIRDSSPEGNTPVAKRARSRSRNVDQRTDSPQTLATPKLEPEVNKSKVSTEKPLAMAQLNDVAHYPCLRCHNITGHNISLEPIEYVPVPDADSETSPGVSIKTSEFTSPRSSANRLTSMQQPSTTAPKASGAKTLKPPSFKTSTKKTAKHATTATTPRSTLKTSTSTTIKKPNVTWAINTKVDKVNKSKDNTVKTWQEVSEATTSKISTPIPEPVASTSSQRPPTPPLRWSPSITDDSPLVFENYTAPNPSWENLSFRGPSLPLTSLPPIAHVSHDGYIRLMENEDNFSDAPSISDVDSITVQKLANKRLLGFLDEDMAQVTDAPVFRPSKQDFLDPIKFFESILPTVSRYGLCKIVAPEGFKPKCNITDEIRFDVTNQYISRLYSRWGPAARELCAIKACLQQQNVSFHRTPLLDGVEVNLPKLYHLVQRHGGLQNVINKKRWTKVAEEMRLNKTPHVEKKLDQIYVKYLLPYDTLAHHERQEIMRKVERCWNKKNQKLLDRALNPLHRQKRLLGESESSGEETEDEGDALNEAEDCVVSGVCMNVSRFKKVAANAMDNHFRAVMPSVAEMEEEYWRLVLLGTEHVCVNTASIDSGEEGYGFTKNKADPYGKHPWNLKMLSQNEGNVLRALGPVLGVTAPTLHLGMVFSTSCWHKDPHGMPWIEYMHSGPGKIWYGIPDEQSDNFRRAVETLCPTLCQNKSMWLSSDIAMIPPKLLREHNISLYRLEQYPGEYILVFPKAYSCSISTGYTESESVYFASRAWLDSVVQVFQETRSSCEPTMFSLEQLLIAIAQDSRSSPDTIVAIYPHIKAMLAREIEHRQMLRARGVKFNEDPESSNPKRKRAGASWNVRDLDECDICRTTLYLSKVRGFTGKKSAVCLEHALKLLDVSASNSLSGSRDVSQLEGVFSFGDQELIDMAEAVGKRLDEHVFR